MEEVPKEILAFLLALQRIKNSRFVTTLEKLHEFSMSHDISIPEELKAWLMEAGDIEIGDGFYGVNPGRLSVDKIWELFPKWQSKGWFPIAGDECGNYYVLDTVSLCGPTHPVFFVDTSEDEERPAYVVASSLWRFLKFFLLKLLKRERSWPFDKQVVSEADPEILACIGVPFPWDD